MYGGRQMKKGDKGGDKRKTRNKKENTERNQVNKQYKEIKLKKTKNEAGKRR